MSALYRSKNFLTERGFRRAQNREPPKCWIGPHATNGRRRWPRSKSRPSSRRRSDHPCTCGSMHETKAVARNIALALNSLPTRPPSRVPITRPANFAGKPEGSLLHRGALRQARLMPRIDGAFSKFNTLNRPCGSLTSSKMDVTSATDASACGAKMASSLSKSSVSSNGTSLFSAMYRTRPIRRSAVLPRYSYALVAQSLWAAKG